MAAQRRLRSGWTRGRPARPMRVAANYARFEAPTIVCIGLSLQ